MACAILIALVSGALPAWAAKLTLPPSAGASPGSSTVVPLTIDNAAGILGSDIVITYNAAVAQATGVSGTALSSGHTLAFNLSPPGTIRIALYGPLPLSGSGALLNISFTSVGSLNNQTILDLVSASLNEGAIPATLVDGKYCVQGLTAEVQNLQLAGGMGGSVVLTWAADPSAVSYNVYRATTANLSDLACFLAGVTGATATDSTGSPLVGKARYYLVTARNCRAESTLGFASSGAERVNLVPCP